MSQDLAERLDLQGSIVPLVLKTFGSKPELKQAMEVKARIYDYQGRDLGVVEAKVVPRFAQVKAVDWSEGALHFEHLKGIDIPPPLLDGQCDLLLGNNCARLIAPTHSKVANENNIPIAHLTKLGWSIAGPTKLPSRLSLIHI